MNNPWTSFYWVDYARDTSHLSLLEHGAYFMLLSHYYITAAPLPANALHLHRICRCTEKAEMDAIDKVLKQYFVLSGKKWHNKRADEEIAKCLDIRTKRQNAAYKKWDANASRLQMQNATHTHTQYKTPLTPLSGGPNRKTNGHAKLTPRELKRVTAELQQIAKASIGTQYDLAAALEKACVKAGVEFERARYMLNAEET